MNAKLMSIIVPVLIFLVTVVVGSYIVFYSLNLDSKKNEVSVMGVSTETKEVIDTSNVTPICESFTNVSKGNVDESGFSFEVVAYETDLIDSIEKVKFSILNSETNVSVKDYICNISDEGNEFEDGSKCLSSIVSEESEGAFVKVKSVLSNVLFPSSGDYFIKAVVESSDGTFSKCVVTKNNE